MTVIYDGDFTGGSSSPEEGSYSNSDFSNTGSLANYSAGSDSIPQVVVTASRVPDPQIDMLNLSPQTAELAYQIKDVTPSVSFTSGRRDIAKQASAMAANVLRSRQFIKNTYKASTLRDKLQAWVDANPGAITQAAVLNGLMSVFNAADPASVADFSKHLAGDAFDVQPVNGALGNQIYNSLNQLQTQGKGKFISNEGGLRRWHFER